MRTLSDRPNHGADVDEQTRSTTEQRRLEMRGAISSPVQGAG